MPVQRPYYNLHQIVAGQYTSGNEFVLEDGTDYIGQYHILPSNQYFTEPRPMTDSVEIFLKRSDVTPEALVYNKIQNRKTSQYEVPVAMDPRPTTEDYNAGEMERYFVQKRTSPLNTIIEIDSIQYNKINTINNPGINGILWNKLKINWKISKLPKEDIVWHNTKTVIESNSKFPGLGRYLQNKLEFFK